MPRPSLRTIVAVFLAATPSWAAVNTAVKPVIMPPAERAWSWRDYDAALQLLRQSAPESLPRISVHAPVIQRIVNPENLVALQDREVPLERRLLSGAELIKSTTGILRLYLEALKTDPARDDDVIWLEGFMLEEASTVVALAEENADKLDPQSAAYAVRRQGVNDMKQGLVQVMAGCMMALQSKSPASNEARRHLAKVLNAEWPQIAKLLPDAARGEMETALKRLAEYEPDPAVKAAFTDFAVR